MDEITKMKKVLASIALSSICTFAQNEEVTSYDDAFFDEPAPVADVPVANSAAPVNAAKSSL